MIDFKIFFKIRIHFEYGLDDRDNQTLEYLQAVYEVTNNRIKVSLHEALMLASIEMVYVYGD